jgi:hypothetical protein
MLGPCLVGRLAIPMLAESGRGPVAGAVRETGGEGTVTGSLRLLGQGDRLTRYSSDPDLLATR